MISQVTISSLQVLEPPYYGIRTFPSKIHYGGKIGAKQEKVSSDFHPEQTRSYFSGPEPLSKIS